MSSDADARRLPSGENATALTPPKWPSRVALQAPDFGSQSQTALPSDGETESWRSDKYATALTNFLPMRAVRLAPVIGSQSRIVLSFDADARSLPSGENATALTEPEWPLRVTRLVPFVGSQSRTVVSFDTDAVERIPISDEDRNERLEFDESECCMRCEKTRGVWILVF